MILLMFWERLAFTESSLGAWHCLDAVHLTHHLLARRVPGGELPEGWSHGAAEGTTWNCDPSPGWRQSWASALRLPSRTHVTGLLFQKPSLAPQTRLPTLSQSLCSCVCTTPLGWELLKVKSYLSLHLQSLAWGLAACMKLCT